MTRQVSLLINDVPIDLEHFVQEFIDHTISGILAGLEGTGEIESVNVAIKGDAVSISLNNTAVPLNPFVTKIIRNTVVGMVSSLKGVSQISKVNINVKR